MYIDLHFKVKTTVGTPACAARVRAYAFDLFETTAAMERLRERRLTASMMACKFEPLPEHRTTAVVDMMTCY